VVTYEELKKDIGLAVDEVLKKYFAPSPSQDLTIEKVGEGSDWSFAWPGGSETYEYTDWEVSGDFGTTWVRIGRTTRPAWGKQDRGRVVVFGPINPNSQTLYPWVEFTETDEGQLSAVVPNPAKPKRILRDGDTLPPRFSGKDIRRVDDVFDGIKDGASLRLVVEPGDVQAIIGHAYYMATLKGRF
jgi:hypothetical protein